MQAIAHQNNIPLNQIDLYLEHEALSIAADIVPITDENRVLTYFGLLQENRDPLLEIKAIIDLKWFYEITHSK